MPGKRSQANLKRKIFGKKFLLIILANCVRNKSCGEKLVPISERGPQFVAQTDFVYIDEDFSMN